MVILGQFAEGHVYRDMVQGNRKRGRRFTLPMPLMQSYIVALTHEKSPNLEVSKLRLVTSVFCTPVTGHRIVAVKESTLANWQETRPQVLGH